MRIPPAQIDFSEGERATIFKAIDEETMMNPAQRISYNHYFDAKEE